MGSVSACSDNFTVVFYSARSRTLNFLVLDQAEPSPAQSKHSCILCVPVSQIGPAILWCRKRLPAILKIQVLTFSSRYYIHPPESLNRDVLLLLPYSQVKVLLDQISTTFKAEVSVPGFPFTLSFFEDGTPYPQLLGTTMSRADINDMQDKIPSPPPSHGEAPADASSALDWSFAAFKQKLDKALAANKKKSTVVKQKKARDRFLVIQDWCKQLRRAQRYFGLRPIVGKVPEPDPNMTWAEQEAFIKGHEKKAHIDLEPLDVSKPAPFPFEQESVIVSIDIESYERNHKLITEIGVSTLDTLDLVGIAPGEGGEDWMKHIRSRHFRIKGREHYVNREFVTGHPDEFQFGESEFVTIEDAGKAVDSCFEWPFSFEYTHDSRLKDIIKDWSVGTASGSSHDIAPTTAREIKARYRDVLGLQKGPRKRAILLLGHDISTDLAYLSLLNSRTFSAPREPTYPAPMPDPTDMDNPIHSILEALDTATLFKVLCRESQTRSLTSIMGELGRTAWYAHCGGNDARYTLEALIGLVIKARIQDDEEKAAKAAALKEAFEQDPWQKEVASETASNSAVVNEDQTVETNGIDGHTNTLDTPRGISPPTHWEAERQRRLATRLAATTREVEEEFKAWDDALNHFTPQLTAESSSPANANTTNSYDIACNAIDDYGSPTPFAQVLQSTHEAKQKKAAKKTNKEKRREWDMKVREEDGVQGPVDWSVGGKDGCGK